MERNNITYSSEKVVDHYLKEEALQKPEKQILELLRNKLSNMKMLDIGVGGGRTTLHFASLVKEYTGIDYSEKMIEVCRNKFSNYTFHTADARDLRMFAENEFDFILFSFNGIDYVSYDDRVNALKEIKRILKPNGYFAFSSHNLQALSKWGRIPFSFNPFALVENIKIHYKRKSINNFKLNNLQDLNYLTVNDGAHDWQLETCYVTPSFQAKIIKEIGYNNLKIFDLKNGMEMSTETAKRCSDNWLYYLCY